MSMHSFPPRRVASAFVFAAALALAACGSSVDGTYTASAGGFFDHLRFASGGKVEVTFMGMTKEGTYVVEDRKVKVSIGNDNQVFSIDDKGCLVGGGPIGTYCKT